MPGAAIPEPDARYLRAAIEAARRARENGNHPFGAVLAEPETGVLLEAENTIFTGRDCTAHAELNLMRLASRLPGSRSLRDCSLYASTEPCPMCSGAIYWGGVRRVVYGLGQQRLYELTGGAESLALPCRDVFAAAPRPIEVVGPFLEDEAEAVHEGFWETGPA